jgi:hypothetical protein
LSSTSEGSVNVGSLEIVVVVATIVAVGAIVGWMLFSRQHPGRAATAAGGVSAPRRLSDDPAKVVDRPADAGAEDQTADVGDARPGPPGPAA